MRSFWVYVLASTSRRLYVGVTNDLRRRTVEHKAGVGSAFTARYRVHHLVSYERHTAAVDAILWEKQIKGWRHERKGALTERTDYGWVDLAARLDAEADEVRRAHRGPGPSLRSG